MQTFERLESNVRRYCRDFPAVFARAAGPFVYSEDGKEYIDFFGGAGALNYGHNNPFIKRRVIEYLEKDGLVHALDLHTPAKRTFLEQFDRLILKPACMDYKVQSCGPSGTEAVEAALKLARKIKGRSGILSFMGAYHGLSRGSLAVTSNLRHRTGVTPLGPATFAPFPFGIGETFDTLNYIDAVLGDPCSGIDRPAAVIVETVQAEGGVCPAPFEWLRGLRGLCDRHDLLLICDDIQVGCHRTGPFFSFSAADIVPDMVVLSKSISGIGTPMSLLLMKREYDTWTPGELAGTFRGNQLAFVGATAALEYADSVGLENMVREREVLMRDYLHRKMATIREIDIRGRGMIWGIDLVRIGGGRSASAVVRRCFEAGVIVESAGRDGSVVKLLPPLNVEVDVLERGCSIISESVLAVAREGQVAGT